MIVSKRPALSFFPCIPIGASLFGLCVVYHLLSPNRGIAESRRQLFGSPHARGAYAYAHGVDLENLFEVLPYRTDCLERSLENCTICGLYSSLLSKLKRNEWKQNKCRLGDSRLPGFTGTCKRRLKNVANFCEQCLTDDIRTFGIGYWRLVHQIPGINHCPFHLRPLLGSCKLCRKSIAAHARWFPPSLKCPFCGGASFDSPSISYSQVEQKFAELCISAISGETEILGPEQRFRLYSPFFKTPIRFVKETELDNIIDIVLSGWSTPTLASLAERICTPIDSSIIKSAIRGDIETISPTVHVALISALQLDMGI